MSRHGYTDDHEPLELGRWRGRVASAMRGKRGQQFLRDLVASLEAMPEKSLHPEVFAEPDGRACAMGVVARSRGVYAEGVRPGDNEDAARALDIAYPLACEVAFLNDEHITPHRVYGPHEPPDKQRWRAMHRWASESLSDPGNTPSPVSGGER